MAGIDNKEPPLAPSWLRVVNLSLLGLIGYNIPGFAMISVPFFASLGSSAAPLEFLSSANVSYGTLRLVGAVLAGLFIFLARSQIRGLVTRTQIFVLIGLVVLSLVVSMRPFVF